MSLIARTQPVRALSPALRQEMFALFRRYYAEVSEARFLADLEDKDDVILLTTRGRSGAGTLAGFSTLARLTVGCGGRIHHGIYSGDTVVDHAHWGDSALGRAFLAYLWRHAVRHPRQPLWWFLVSKGYKTYLLMANNFDEHWPRHEQPTPAPERALQHAFATARFRDAYDPERGVVHFDLPRGQLAEGVADIDPGLRATHPRIDFFARANPGWAHGDELVCLARMRWSMPLRYAWKKRHTPVPARLRRAP